MPDWEHILEDVEIKTAGEGSAEDECINCHELIVSIGAPYLIAEMSDGSSFQYPSYHWVHKDSKIAKCDPAKSPHYAAGKKRP
jgi:hypothetical protein